MTTQTPGGADADLLEKAHAHPRHGGVSWIAAYKLVKGTVLLVAALGAWRLRMHDPEGVLDWFVAHTWLEPQGRLVAWVTERLALLTDDRLRLFSWAGGAFGALQLAEAWGLYTRAVWAEWTVVVLTTIPVPFEAWHLAHEPSLYKALVLLGNAGIAGYLWWRRADFLSRRERVALRLERHAAKAPRGEPGD